MLHHDIWLLFCSLKFLNQSGFFLEKLLRGGGGGGEIEIAVCEGGHL